MRIDFGIQRRPDKPPTPAQWHVLAWAVIVDFVLLGAVAMICASRIEAEHAAVAGEIQSVGLAIWGLAGFAYVLKRVVQRIFE